jgi:hypothetical protein
MKNDAQAILLFTGHPLEPIVALQVQKSIQSQLLHENKSAAAFSRKRMKPQTKHANHKPVHN